MASSPSTGLKIVFGAMTFGRPSESNEEDELALMF